MGHLHSDADFSLDGKVSINDNQFFGTYAVFGSSSYISIAIADFQGESITSYIENVVGLNMGGKTVGTSVTGNSHYGVWSATLLLLDETKKFLIPS